MRRRTLITTLAGTAGVLAGCVQSDDGESPGERTDGDDSGGDSETPDWTDTGSRPVVDRFDSEPARPECRVESETVTDVDGNEHETAGTVPYPDAASFDDAPSFLAAFEEAYVTHDVLCEGRGDVLGIADTVHDSERLDRHEDISTVFLLRHAVVSSHLTRDGQLSVVDPGPPGGVVYAVDGTGVARAEVERTDILGPDDRDLSDVDVAAEAPDPLETGTLVATFD